MYYQCGKMNEPKLFQCLHTFIFDDSGMRENDMEAIIKRVEFVFRDKMYMQRVDKSDKRWLDEDINEVFSGIVGYLKNLKENP